MIALYLLILALSIISCFVGFAVECVERNIVHIQNGRAPNAGVALFPDIPFIPIAYVVSAWAINKWHDNAGFMAVAAYWTLRIIFGLYAYKKTHKKFDTLMQTRPMSEKKGA